MKKMIFLSVALATGASVIPLVPLTAGIRLSTADELQTQCSHRLIADPGSPGGHRFEIVCDNVPTQALVRALAPAEAEFDRLKLFAGEISHVSTSELRVYQFVDDVCGNIACHGLTLDKIRAVIGSEINLRTDAEKNEYTRITTVTGSTSTIISILSLCISFLTFRRGSGRRSIATTDTAESAVAQKS